MVSSSKGNCWGYSLSCLRWDIWSLLLLDVLLSRLSLVSIQRSFAKEPGLIAEGRDMGSVIFPNAEVKFFLTANNETKAKRRLNQLKEKGINVSLTQLIDELNERDKRDLNRKASPLIIPDDALVIETDNKSIKDVQEEAIKHIKSSN